MQVLRVKSTYRFTCTTIRLKAKDYTNGCRVEFITPSMESNSESVVVIYNFNAIQ